MHLDVASDALRIPDLGIIRLQLAENGHLFRPVFPTPDGEEPDSSDCVLMGESETFPEPKNAMAKAMIGQIHLHIMHASASTFLRILKYSARSFSSSDVVDAINECQFLEQTGRVPRPRAQPHIPTYKGRNLAIGVFYPLRHDEGRLSRKKNAPCLMIGCIFRRFATIRRMWNVKPSTIIQLTISMWFDVFGRASRLSMGRCPGFVGVMWSDFPTARNRQLINIHRESPRPNGLAARNIDNIKAGLEKRDLYIRCWMVVGTFSMSHWRRIWPR